MAGQADARLDAFGLGFARDETRIFVVGPVFAREHEHEPAHAVIKERARDGGQHQLTIPGATRPGTSRMRASSGICQVLRNASTRC